MLNKLTEEQESRLTLYRDKWLQIGLSTEPTDRVAAERGVDLAYKAAGLAPPTNKIWLRSPLEGYLATYGMSQTKPQMWAQVWAQMWAQVWAQVGDQVGDQVWDQVGAQVWDQVRVQVGDQVGNQVGNQVRDQVGNQVWDQVWRAGYGSQDAYWLGFYEFFLLETPVTGLEKLEGLFLLAQSCGWWWPFQDTVILTEKPVFLARDEQNNLHHERQAAISYSDGWGVYSWHGVRVPEWVITQPEQITVEKIEEETNQEVRRVLIERFGEGRYLEESGAELIHEDNFGKLYRKDVEGDEPIEMVQVINSTPEPDGSRKKYWLRVPPNTCKTAHAAVAWTFGLTAEQYNPVVET